MAEPDRYEPYRAIAAEGARVGFTVCRDCGAVVMLDEAVPFDAPARHDEWHDSVREVRDAVWRTSALDDD